jgi:signal transduction histidine kinase
MKIRYKIILFSTLWLICILLCVNFLVYFMFIKIATDNESESMRHKAENMLVKLGWGIFLTPNREEELQNYLPEDGMLRVVNADKQVVNLLYNHPDMEKIPPELAAGYAASLYRQSGHRILMVRLPIYEQNQLAGTLEMAEMMTSLEDNVSILISILITSDVAAILLSLLGGVTLSRIILGPIARLIFTMEEIESSLSFKKIPLPGEPKDELYKMTATFNRMMTRIEESFAKQQQFISDASHELKTTLTIIESYVNMLRRWGNSDMALQKEALETIHSETIRMRKMTQQLLDLAASEKGRNFSPERFDLIEFCARMARMLGKMHRRQVKIVTGQKELPITADKMKMKQLMLILMDNALKYSKDEIEIHLQSSRTAVHIRIKDYGIGIPEDEIGQVFERFYRVDKARTRKSGGTGLGLPIAKAIVLEHKGNIEIESREGEGTEVIVTLPLSGPPAA